MRTNHHFSAPALLLCIALFLSCSIAVQAFVPSLIPTRHSSSTPPHVRRNDDNDDQEEKRYQDALAHNQIRTDVNNFLTQRAIQSFIFLLEQCRDPHTVRWMEVSVLFVMCAS